MSPLNILEGNVVLLAAPKAGDLPVLTQHVLEENRLTAPHLHAGNPLAALGLQAGKITHVIYIVRENRSYDQVMGDEPRGNGDSRYVLFRRDVTPNAHALAERFVLLDNFYTSGEVSGDGWVWSTQAMANEFTERNVPYHYSHRGRSFDFEGQVNEYPTGGFPAVDAAGKPLSNDQRFKNGATTIPDVGAAPGGHLWDMARRHELTLRNYGFFSSIGVGKAGNVVIPDNYPNSVGLQPGGHDLAGVTDLDFRRFDLDYPDGEAPQIYFKQTGDAGYLRLRRTYGPTNAPSRFTEWKREFQLMLQKDPTGSSRRAPSYRRPLRPPPCPRRLGTWWRRRTKWILFMRMPRRRRNWIGSSGPA